MGSLFFILNLNHSRVAIFDASLHLTMPKLKVLMVFTEFAKASKVMAK